MAIQNTKIELGSRCLIKLYHFDFEKNNYVGVAKFEKYKGGSITGYIVYYD